MNSPLTMSRRRMVLVSGKLALTLLTVAPPGLAATTIKVGDGTPRTCTEATLQAALIAAAVDGADVIQFDCGPNPLIIPVTANQYLPDGTLVALLPPNQTTLDGGGRITLRLSDCLGTLLVVPADATVTLRNLTIQGVGVPAPLPYGTTAQPNILNRGVLVIRNVTVTGGGDSTTVAPSAIDNYGTLQMQDSTVAGITGTDQSSAPIRNFANAAIEHSSFLNNSHRPSDFFLENGGAISNAGRLAVNNSVFADNAALGSSGSGGAIDNVGGILTVNGSQFFRNHAYRGGAIDNRRGGSTTLTNSTFGHNVGFEGGAVLGGYAEGIFNSVSLKHCTFFGNSGTWGGAIELQNGRLQVENSEIRENFALNGGGISVFRAELTVVKSEITSNVADYGGGIQSQFEDAITLVNSRVTGNEANQGGGVYLSSTASLTLVRTDIVQNTPDDVYRQQ